MPELDPNSPAYHAIARAITLIHAEAMYYEGLDVLCSLIGWGSFRHESGFYPSEAMADWVRAKGGGRGVQGSSKLPELPKIGHEQPEQPMETVATGTAFPETTPNVPELPKIGHERHDKVIPLRKPVSPWARCRTCNRVRVPNKGKKHARKDYCPECGRGFRKRIAKEVAQ